MKPELKQNRFGMHTCLARRFRQPFGCPFDTTKPSKRSPETVASHLQQESCYQQIDIQQIHLVFFLNILGIFLFFVWIHVLSGVWIRDAGKRGYNTQCSQC